VATDQDLPIAGVVEWRPPHAAALNPEESGQGNGKQPLRHAIPADVNELRTQVDRGLARLRERPDLFRGCFRHAGLQVNQLWRSSISPNWAFSQENQDLVLILVCYIEISELHGRVAGVYKPSSSES
jgi:hypothetical protein